VTTRSVAGFDFTTLVVEGGGGGDQPPTTKETSEEEHEGDPFHKFGEFFIKLFNRFAALLLVYKGVQATYYCMQYAWNDGNGEIGDGRWYNKARIVLGRGILLSLEFLLVSDILETMLFGANVQRLIAISLTAVIRTMIDYFTSKEIEEAEHALHKAEARCSAQIGKK
jgi:uncharacterized membrane protein